MPKNVGYEHTCLCYEASGGYVNDVKLMVREPLALHHLQNRWLQMDLKFKFISNFCFAHLIFSILHIVSDIRKFIFAICAKNDNLRRHNSLNSLKTIKKGHELRLCCA